MDFLLWAVRSLHLVAVIAWLGGMMYQTATLRGDEASLPDAITRKSIASARPLVWMSVWTILVTGVALMLFSPRFVFFRYQDVWSVLLGLKQLVFVAMVVCAYGTARMFTRVDEFLRQGKDEKDVLPYYRQMLRLGKVTVGLGLIAVLMAAGMT